MGKTTGENSREIEKPYAEPEPDMIEQGQQANPSVSNDGGRTGRRKTGILPSAFYGSGITLVALIWLTRELNLDSIRDQWLVLFLLILLRVGVEQLNLSSLLLNDSCYFKGVPGRAITWSAVLIFGPVALWLDVIAMLADSFILWRRNRQAIRTGDKPFWQVLRKLTIVPVRDMMPAILVVILFPNLIGSIDGYFLAGADGTSMIYATLAKTAISILMILPLYILDITIIERPTRLFPGLITAARIIRFLAGAVLFFGLADMAGLVTAVFYSETSPWSYVAVTVGIAVVALLVHQVNRIGFQNQIKAQANLHLRDLSSSILALSPDDLDLPALLADYGPLLFPQANLEVRLLPDQTLFLQIANAPLITDPLIDLLVNSTNYVEIPGENDTHLGLAVPIIDSQLQDIIGVVALSQVDEVSDLAQELDVLEGLASLVAASVKQVELYDEALASQAEAFQAEVFAQAYEAELNKAYDQITQELSLAGQIQTSFLPDEVPDVSGWQIAVSMEPARETSGDYYDFIQLPDGLLGLLIADVTDKGIGSALYMALSRTIIRTFATEFFRDPARVLKAANRRILEDSNSDLFVTVFYAVLDPAIGSITYCNAGHNPPFLIRAEESKSQISLTRTALPLGLFENEDWQQETIEMLPGDILTMYTDGVTEAQDERDSFFGDDRLRRTVQDNSNRTAQIIEDKVLRALENFTQDAPQYDDITLMILKREP